MNKKIIIPVVLLSFALILTAGFAFNSPQTAPASEKIKWVTIEEAVAKAEVDGKKILIDVYTDWCGWCKRMDRDTYGKDNIANFVNANYHAVRFDAEQKEDITLNGQTFKFVPNGRRGYHELAASLLNGQMSYPHTVFLDSDMSMITKIPGYKDAKFMLPVLHYLHDEVYKENISFDAYMAEFSKEQ